MPKKEPSVIGIAAYSPDQYAMLLATATDPGALHKDWEDWKKEKEKVKSMLKARGYLVLEVDVNIDSLHMYCMEKGKENNADTRAEFTTHLTRMRLGIENGSF